MKHLHLRFILASIALGFSGVFFLGSAWNAHAMPTSEWTPIRTYLSAMLSMVIGIILFVYGYFGVREELKSKPSHEKRRR